VIVSFSHRVQKSLLQPPTDFRRKALKQACVVETTSSVAYIAYALCHRMRILFNHTTTFVHSSILKTHVYNKNMASFVRRQIFLSKYKYKSAIMTQHITKNAPVVIYLHRLWRTSLIKLHHQWWKCVKNAKTRPKIISVYITCTFYYSFHISIFTFKIYVCRLRNTNGYAACILSVVAVQLPNIQIPCHTSQMMFKRDIGCWQRRKGRPRWNDVY
jgi:hypothetical protein